MTEKRVSELYMKNNERDRKREKIKLKSRICHI